MFELLIFLDGGCEIYVISEEVTRESHIGWKCANRKMITADGNQFDLTQVAESVHINLHGIVISITIILEKSGSKQVRLGHPWDTHRRNCERNLENGSPEITIPVVDESEQVVFNTTVPGHMRDRVTSSSEN